VGQGESGSFSGLTPKEQKRFNRFRGMVERFPRIRRVMGGGQRAAFRLTRGRVGGTLQGVPVGLLTTTGRRSGQKRTVPIGYTDDGSRFLVAASNFGLDRPPAWLLNLRADPNAAFRTRAGVERVVARELTETERTELWQRLLEDHPVWGAAQASTQRHIALVALDRSQHQSSD